MKYVAWPSAAAVAHERQLTYAMGGAYTHLGSWKVFFATSCPFEFKREIWNGASREEPCHSTALSTSGCSRDGGGWVRGTDGEKMKQNAAIQFLICIVHTHTDTLLTA